MTKDPTPKPERLSTKWRREREEQVRDVAAGTFPADEAFLAELFPDAFLDPLDELLVAYEKDVTAAIASNGRGPQAFCALYAAVEKLVLALNDLNENGDGCYIETGEREALCEYMELIIEHEGLSIEEMGKDLGFGMGELTDEWRDW
jgi:hypothetical protein